MTWVFWEWPCPSLHCSRLHASRQKAGFQRKDGLCSEGWSGWRKGGGVDGMKLQCWLTWCLETSTKTHVSSPVVCGVCSVVCVV